jgi:WD40 repeat protein
VPRLPGEGSLKCEACSARGGIRRAEEDECRRCAELTHARGLLTLVTGRAHARGQWTQANVSKSRVTAVVYTPDGSRIVAYSRGEFGGAVSAWDANSGQEVGHTSVGGGLLLSPLLTTPAEAFSRDCTHVALEGIAGKVEVWDTRSGKRVAELSDRLIGLGPRAGVLSLAFSPDDFRVVSGGPNNALTVWDARPEEHLQALRSQRPSRIETTTGTNSPALVSARNRWPLRDMPPRRPRWRTAPSARESCQAAATGR